MSGVAPYNDKNGRHSIAFTKEKRIASHHRPQDPILLTPLDIVPQMPSARNTPMISFQPHYTEISTDWPSVSGRLFLHIPKIPGKKFHFVSLTLQLRLKEAMAWTRQDLVTFEIEKQNWSQTVWERNLTLPYQDRQVGEGNEAYVAVVKEPSSKNHQNRIEIAADEWRWEWLMPVTEKEVRPESFEGSMGNVWYELEAKCLFRWDDVDMDGNIVVSTGGPTRTHEAAIATLKTHGSDRSTASSPFKAVEGSSIKSKSLANVLGKLRVGGKSKKIQLTGDFTPADQHDQFIKESLRMRKNSMPYQSGVNGHAGMGAHREGLLSASSKTQSSPHLSMAGSDSLHAPPEHPPFLIRKVLKLYFIKPPPNTSSNPSFFLPPPSMALPTLPGTRRLKAIIPGARIQVQIQIPSLIPIPGYAQTSQLVPDKKGGLVISKYASQQQQQHQHHYQHNNTHTSEIDSGYLDNFQVALTVRKVTQREINKNDHLRKRYNSASTGLNSASVFASVGDSLSGGTATVRKQLQSSNLDLYGQYAAGSRGGEDGGSSAAASTVPAERPWRKEIHVRKVRCEFWQKESCRFPSNSADSPSRSIKYPMGPAFVYSEKEQVRERQRERSHSFSQLSSAPHSQLSSEPRSPIHQTTAVSWDTSVTSGSAVAGASGAGEDPRKPVRKTSNSALPMSLTLKTTSLLTQSTTSTPSSPLQALTLPHNYERKGSNASQYSSMITSQPRTSFCSSHASHPHLSQSSKPFMLLIPVPLDSPKLRQTFAWPSAETPAPTPSKPYEPVPLPMPRGTPSNVSPGTHYMAMANTDASLAAGTAGSTTGTSDSPRSSESGGLAGDDPLGGVGVGSRHRQHGHSRSHPHQSPAAKAIATRPRIEVKHYLSFRLSIDMLEYEGEPDQDEDLDLEALEEQQLQQIWDRQEPSAYRPNAVNHSTTLSRAGTTLSTVPASGSSSATSSATSLSILPSTIGQGYGSDIIGRATMKNYTAVASASGASSMISNQTGSVVSTTTSAATATGGMMTIQPALMFLNSTAGLLDMDSELDESSRHHHHPPGSRQQGLGTSQRRNSADSGPSPSNPDPSQGQPPAIPQPSFVSAYDPQQRRGSNASQGTVKSTSTTDSSGRHHQHSTSFVTEALGALKKKVSTSALSSIINVVNPATLTPVPPVPHSYSITPVPLSSQQQYHIHQQQRPHRTQATVHKLKDFVIRVPITVVIQVEDLGRVGTAGIDGSDSVTQTTGASATVTETLDGSHESEVGTILTAELRSDEENRSVSSEIRSVHGQIEGEDRGEDEDAEYVEGQFILEQE
ncbi:hypothetical protein BGX29_002094 [Mortierella sp. GBA35]|nr:hypothetical protein BGX29_002094 [Mortierella sp. GBA35]